MVPHLAPSPVRICLVLSSLVYLATCCKSSRMSTVLTAVPGCAQRFSRVGTPLQHMEPDRGQQRQRTSSITPYGRVSSQSARSLLPRWNGTAQMVIEERKFPSSHDTRERLDKVIIILSKLSTKKTRIYGVLSRSIV